MGLDVYAYRIRKVTDEKIKNITSVEEAKKMGFETLDMAVINESIEDGIRSIKIFFRILLLSFSIVVASKLKHSARRSGLRIRARLLGVRILQMLSRIVFGMQTQKINLAQ